MGDFFQSERFKPVRDFNDLATVMPAASVVVTGLQFSFSGYFQIRGIKKGPVMCCVCHERPVAWCVPEMIGHIRGICCECVPDDMPTGTSSETEEC